MTRTHITTLFFVSTLACGGKGVLADYEAARAAALADPGPPPAVWEPDAALFMTPDVVEAVIASALTKHRPLTGQFEVQVPLAGKAVVTPELVVRSLKIASSPRCADCLAVDARLDGEVRWKLGGTTGRSPVDLTAAFDTELETSRQADGQFAFTARPREVREIDLKLGGVAASLAPRVEKGLKDWVQANVLDRAEPIPLGVAGSPELPLRAARMTTSSNGVALALLTRSPTPVALPKVAPKLQSGWQLDVSSESLLGLAKAASFAAGPIAYEVVAEPRRLSIVPGRFSMDLRLWRLTGKGWWRDYTIEGDLRIAPDGVDLAATSVVEGEKSPGAVWVDPLAALAEGVILRSIEQAVQATLPSGISGQGGDLGYTVNVRAVTPGTGTLRVTGDLTVTPVRTKPAPRPPR